MTHAHPHAVPGHDQRRLTLALCLTASFCVVELVGGWLSNSLALSSDAGHMFTDVAALAGSLLAIRLGQRPPDERNTFGYYRAEILAAFVSGLVLWFLVGLIFREAYDRLWNPPEVQGGAMMAIALAGLAVNVASLFLLRSSRADNLNVRAAFVHVLGDALGSLGAIAGALLIYAGGWNLADPLASIAIGLLLLYSSAGIVREAAAILMQSAPPDIRLTDIENCLRAISGVLEVHDLHVWALTSNRYLLSVHLVVGDGTAPSPILGSAQQALHDRFGIAHATVQIDCAAACAEHFRAH